MRKFFNSVSYNIYFEYLQDEETCFVSMSLFMADLFIEKK